MHPTDRLQQSIERTGSLACVGLDPRPGLIPPVIAEKALETFDDTREAVAAAFTEFCCGILDAVVGRCAAVKPQVACFEAYGSDGLMALEDVCAYARQLAIPVIADAKRGDIGTTAEHYQQAFLGAPPGLGKGEMEGLGADWLTVNPYFGSEGVLPFLANPETGVFVLVKTSNPSSGELQDQRSGDGTVMERVAALVAGWGRERRGECKLSAVGAVVGATYPEQARRLRQLMPDAMFLVPGYGAQGGTAADALAGLRSDKRGVLVNSSRAILGAWQRNRTGLDWQAAAGAALDEMNLDLNRLR